MMLRVFVVGCLIHLFSTSIYAAPPAKPSPPSVVAPATIDWIREGKMPYTNLHPSKIVPNLCIYKYRVTTSSEDCQQYVDQALGYYYSYVWMEAARSFETALKYDPKCAFAWWGLSRSIEKWSKGDWNTPLQKAQQLLDQTGHRERLLITSRLQEKGMISGVSAEDRKKKAQATLDELLTLYEDDEEGWFCRAQLSDGASAVPYYKALLRLNPLHPGANHELVHFFENYRRPALGWPYAVGYMQSSPSIPHAFHMQAHLAMRIGKWERTTDWSAKAIVLEKAYHKELNVDPKDDHQFNHHMETLTRSLVHDGRFAEARRIKEEALGYKYKFNPEWFRMHVAEQDWAEAEKIIADFRRDDKANGKSWASYLSAVLYLEQGQAERAAKEIDVLRQIQQQKKTDRSLERRLMEVQGRYLCQTGSGDQGLKLIKQIVEKTKDDYSHHAWGGGAYYMEVWGSAALECGNPSEAEEAFLEALAHDAGSVRAALGLQALCERLNRSEEAQRYAKVAWKCWSKADYKHFDLLRNSMTRRASNIERIATGIGGSDE